MPILIYVNYELILRVLLMCIRTHHRAILFICVVHYA